MSDEGHLDEGNAQDHWDLRLYVAGSTPKCTAAVKHLKEFCEEHIPGRYNIEVVDLLENPQLAKGDQILWCASCLSRCARSLAT